MTDGPTSASADIHPEHTVSIREHPAWRASPALPLLISLLLLIGACILWASGSDLLIWIGIAVIAVVLVVLFSGLIIVAPGTTKVLLFFGRYIGTVRRTGLSFVPPLTQHTKLSVRVHNFETAELKVNDADGNPVNIAAIVVWQVSDTAMASFAVQDYQDFVEVQAEAALRHVTTTHPYDNAADDRPTLRGATDLVSSELAHEVAERVVIAGVEVIEVRISKLAYAPEIAQAMLQRQQAGAIIAARERIVEGAVTMVESALARIEEEDLVELDNERKAAMISNLLVVLCGEARATPVVNTGTLYS